MEHFLCRSLFLLLVTLIGSSYSQNEPCTAMDPEFTSPSAKPTLFIYVNEADQQKLDSGGTEVMSEIRLHGASGGTSPNGITLTFGSKHRTIDPNEYFVFEQEPNTPFRNMIRLIKPIDRDGPTDSVMDDSVMDNFRLKCVPSNNQSSVYWYDVSLLIRDVNDNFPQLEKSEYSTVVNELFPAGHNLPIKVAATDKDAGNNGQITFEIPVTSDGYKISDHLMIHNETGQLSLRKAFDYESLITKEFKVPVIVHDNGDTAKLTSTAMLTINVADGDDQGPQFKHAACERAFGGKCFAPTYNAVPENVVENKPIQFASSGGGPLMEIKAKDGDTLAAKVNFKISAVIPGVHRSSFELKVKPPQTDGDEGYYTASLVLTKSIDKEVLRGTVVYVTATENTARQNFNVGRILFTGRNTLDQIETNGYTDETVALIVVVAILAVIVIIGIGALIFTRFRSKGKKMTGHINEGMSL